MVLLSQGYLFLQFSQVLVLDLLLILFSRGYFIFAVFSGSGSRFSVYFLLKGVFISAVFLGSGSFSGSGSNLNSAADASTGLSSPIDSCKTSSSYCSPIWSILKWSSNSCSEVLDLEQADPGDWFKDKNLSFSELLLASLLAVLGKLWTILGPCAASRVLPPVVENYTWVEFINHILNRFNREINFS